VFFCEAKNALKCEKVEKISQPLISG
jgi:hypothetical protein